MHAIRITWILAPLAAALFTAGCSGAPSSEERRLFEETARARCTACHGPSQWKGKRFTAEQWKAVLDRMIEHGARVSPDEYQRLLIGPGK